MSDMRPEEAQQATEAPQRPVELAHDQIGKRAMRRRLRWLVWAVAVAAFTGYVALARVHTRLGVDAPSWDKNGRENVWRVWWRARHEVVDIGSERAEGAGYIGLALLLLALSILACWVALVPDDPADPPDVSPDSVET
jgi:hypothetical protein